jgi:Ca-activated chloride channel family protein
MRGRLAALLLLVAGSAAAQVGSLAGKPLADALQQLEAQGLTIIYSSELVRPDMKVAREPTGTRPADVLAEILRPHGLALQPGPAGRLLVVRAGQESSSTPRTVRELVFGSELRVIRVDVSVLGKDGHFVKDLRAEDLEIYEDGVRQTGVSFTRRDVPVSVVLLFDASDSIGERLPLARAAALGFVGTLRPEDDASVIQFNDAVTVLQAPTAERASLREAIERIESRGATGLNNALYATLRSLPPPERDAAPRRRVVLLLSDGEDTSSLLWEEQVVELARRREATIHVIDVGPPNADNRSAPVLRLLSAESGGELHRPRQIQDLAAVYARIDEELRSQYTVGYTSSSPADDGRWRNIEVKVRGRGDVTVRHRTGYYAVP